MALCMDCKHSSDQCRCYGTDELSKSNQNTDSWKSVALHNAEIAKREKLSARMWRKRCKKLQKELDRLQ